MRTWLSFLVLSLFIVVPMSGCSVFMAASSNKDRDLSSIRIGRTTRPQAEKILGKPYNFSRKSFGDVATYQYFSGDEASYGRAALYAGLDVVTGFLAEFATSPVESLQGDKHTVVITYTPTGIIKDIQHQVQKAPLPDPDSVVMSSDAPAEHH